jgi:hypothetical protein
MSGSTAHGGQQISSGGKICLKINILNLRKKV